MTTRDAAMAKVAKKKGAAVSYLANIEYPHAKTWDRTRTNVKFDIANIHYSLCNAIRRIMIAEVDTIAFRDKPHAECSINIKINNTPHNNEMLAHRIALVPIHVAHPDKFDVSQYLFVLDVSNNDNNVRYVTSADFKVKYIPTSKFLSPDDTAQFFKPDPITGDYALITVLKSRNYLKIPNNPELATMIPKVNDTEINKLYVEALATRGNCCNGVDNSHYSPVCVSCYTNKIDDTLAAAGCAEYLITQKQLAEQTKTTVAPDELLTKRFYINESYRYYSKDDRGDPNLYTFEIETTGVIPPLIIFNRAMDILKLKLTNFLNNLLKYLGVSTDTPTSQHNAVQVIPSSRIAGFEILVNNEDDTLGNLLQSHLCRLYADYSLTEKVLAVIGYSRIHPCARKIKFMISSTKYSSMDDIVEHTIKPCITQLCILIEKIQTQLLKSPQFLTESRQIALKSI
jgi:DNA-directed RNA polymerase subunit L